MADYVKVADKDGVERLISAKELAGNLFAMRGLTQFLVSTTATDVTQTTPLPAHLREVDGTDVAIAAKLGILTETAPTTDTASSGINGRLQRIAQRLTSLLLRGGATGSAVPADAQYTGIRIGANLVGLTGLTLGSHNAAAMALVDGSGVQITSFGGSLTSVSMHHRVVTNSTNAVNIKASAGVLHGLNCWSGHDYAIQICFHNTAGTPTAGSAVVRKFVCPAGQPINITIPGGVAFATGIGMTIVYSTAGTVEDAVATAIDATNKAVVEVAYV